MGSQQRGHWVTACPCCHAAVRVGDGPDGLLADHPEGFAPWTDNTGPPCSASGLTIAAARVEEIPQ